ncbi:hypothetical protein BDU57DRAFT_340067 [Ampelomyces quisqualis]|uniref:Uncharacterized protein n=1 Tax=Ampelomyces quisqualis TaxID=50730 RepID=A0A6A5QEM2_AMPQU|nr:hypothetical protein BDU57DRAFT_340067 [Ampelomyces quisqualis]
MDTGGHSKSYPRTLRSRRATHGTNIRTQHHTCRSPILQLRATTKQSHGRVSQLSPAQSAPIACVRLLRSFHHYPDTSAKHPDNHPHSRQADPMSTPLHSSGRKDHGGPSHAMLKTILRIANQKREGIVWIPRDSRELASIVAIGAGKDHCFRQVFAQETGRALRSLKSLMDAKSGQTRGRTPSLTGTSSEPTRYHVLIMVE